MSKHTKGPWAINEFLVYAENGNGCTLATINSTSKGISDEEAQANARLIAAAPEMKNMLEDMAKRITNSEEWWMDDPNRGGFDLEAIEALLNKATS
ncbi:hypothetical protein LCGC14_1707590 [marine sediment metagenome]|uniref:Uncharacterized protein n=1 Tax=marine sediment metagenome TaxID=412755 RepID=A0A0F9HGK8_9ZZZZ